MKYFYNLELKNFSFYEVWNQLLFSLESKTLNQFLDIVLNILLFGLLCRMNTSTSSNLIKDVSNIQMGSSIVNRVNDFPPFLPSINPKYKYTLVLDIDETLVHYSFTTVNGSFLVRPYCFEFLEELNELYEIITFSAGTKDYCDNILNSIDKDNKIFKYRLYRHHCRIFITNFIKDLNLIGRDLSKVIFIDNLKEIFKFQPNNGILINTRVNVINDLELKDLSKILKDIVALNVNDVRPVIRKINDEIKYKKNEIRPYKNINIAKLIGINKTEVFAPKQEGEIPNNDIVIINNNDENKNNISNIMNAENNNIDQPIVIHNENKEENKED